MILTLFLELMQKNQCQNKALQKQCSRVVLIIVSVFVVTVASHFFVVKFKSSHIFTCFCELSFFHALAHIPVSIGVLMISYLKIHTTVLELRYSVFVKTHQWTNALNANMRSNFRSRAAQASTIAVELERQQTARATFARSEPGILVGGW